MWTAVDFGSWGTSWQTGRGHSRRSRLCAPWSVRPDGGVEGRSKIAEVRCGPFRDGPVRPCPWHPKRRVKVNSVLDQADEAEVPELQPDELGGCWKSDRRQSTLGLSPCADFALFVNFQHRFAKSLKFKHHIFQPDGSFRTVEVPGPPNYDSWPGRHLGMSSRTRSRTPRAMWCPS